MSPNGFSPRLLLLLLLTLHPPPPFCALSATVIEFLRGASLRVFCPSLVGELNQLDTLIGMLGQRKEPD